MEQNETSAAKNRVMAELIVSALWQSSGARINSGPHFGGGVQNLFWPQLHGESVVFIWNAV